VPVAVQPSASPAVITDVASATATVFRLPTATPTQTRAPQAFEPTATPACGDNLRFVEDLTVPDGTIVSAGTVLDKRWRVENSGSCNWNAHYQLVRISGPALGVGDQQALFPARAGTQAVIRMLLTAPSDPGAYRSAWQAVGPGGESFGDPIYVDFLVVAANP
jgi:hypothetical protein